MSNEALKLAATLSPGNVAVVAVPRDIDPIDIQAATKALRGMGVGALFVPADADVAVHDCDAVRSAMHLSITDPEETP